jgi:hypothetical protein
MRRFLSGCVCVCVSNCVRSVILNNGGTLGQLRTAMPQKKHICQHTRCCLLQTVSNPLYITDFLTLNIFTAAVNIPVSDTIQTLAVLLTLCTFVLSLL